MPSSLQERERWNRKYRESPDSWLEPDPFLPLAFSQFVRPRFPAAGHALDLAGGAGRHAIWLAKQGWEVTLIDISETGVENACRNAGPWAPDIRFVVDDLTHFEASQTQFDLVMAFFYLERKIFPQIVRALRPGGMLIYKTYMAAKTGQSCGPKNPAYLLQPGELAHLADGLSVLHYREVVAETATAEMIATSGERVSA